jgi:hypothetical protein
MNWLLDTSSFWLNIFNLLFHAVFGNLGQYEGNSNYSIKLWS